jgi:hypothetical protein
MTPQVALNWHPLEVFAERFRRNLAALSGRDASLAERLAAVKPSQGVLIAAVNDDVFLGRSGAAGIEVIPNAITPAAAGEIANGVFPSGAVHWPVVIGGLGYGWLWDRVTKLTCKVDAAPGHRPPIYLLTGDIERLWAVLHVLDWQQMLANQRFPIFVGTDAAAQLRQFLLDHPTWPRPHACVRVEQSLWAEDFNALTQQVNGSTRAQTEGLAHQLAAAYPQLPERLWAQRLRGSPLRVLGITSRFTTFLQYSMRDWLAAFEELGHETKLLIEDADHVQLGQWGYARGAADFRPDLVLMIDHFRAEVPVLPANVPCVMWVQDRLPNIFSPGAGRAQSRLDFVLGYGRHECVHALSYPPQRFLPAPVGVNEKRFAPTQLSADQRQQFGCDVSFVSNCTVPADVLIRREIERTESPEVRKLLADCFDRFAAIYQSGDSITELPRIKAILDESMRTKGVRLEEPGPLIDLFVQRINNALFRHQSLQWLIELDVNLHLWGNGWELNPQFGPFARGIAHNEQMLCSVYAGSAINLQVTPFGAAHQRLYDGLAAGGFFLLRHTDGEDAERIYRRIWQWCEQEGVRSGDELVRRADAEISQVFNEIATITGEHPVVDINRFFNGMAETASTGFTRTASTLWPEYDRVAFRSREQLHRLVARFLASPDERRHVASRMRERVLENLTYRRITERLLRFMTEDLAREMPAAKAA